MSVLLSSIFMESIGKIDPSPFFVLSLIPYILFLIFAQKTSLIPKTSLWGYRFTLIFVLMTIVLAIVAKVFYSEELTNIDPLHGLAESFLTISDALIAFGFLKMYQSQDVKNS